MPQYSSRQRPLQPPLPPRGRSTGSRSNSISDRNKILFIVGVTVAYTTAVYRSGALYMSL